MEWENNDHFSLWNWVSGQDFWPSSGIVLQPWKDNFLREMDSLTMNIILLIPRQTILIPCQTMGISMDYRKPGHPWVRNTHRLPFFQRHSNNQIIKPSPKGQEKLFGNLLGIEPTEVSLKPDFIWFQKQWMPSPLLSPKRANIFHGKPNCNLVCCKVKSTKP